MVDVSGDVIRLIYQLLPGFLAAWIFYGLTAHLRMSPFERTVQALIFTAIVRACVLVISGIFLGIGTITRMSVGPWTENIDYLWSVIIAFILGHVLAYVANNNLYHVISGKPRLYAPNFFSFGMV